MTAIQMFGSEQEQASYWLVTYGVVSDIKISGPLTKDELVSAAREAAKEPGMMLFAFEGTRIFTSKGPLHYLLLDPPVPLFDENSMEPDPEGYVNDQPFSLPTSQSPVKTPPREQAWDK